MALERVVDPAEVYERDIHWINACDAMIAEVSTPSHGVGYELAYALGLGKPVLVCYRDGATVSKMITGNDHENLVQLAYQGDKELLEAIDLFLADLGSE
jgi:nucleoside 2-deoxyribosyltransferase